MSCRTRAMVPHPCILFFLASPTMLSGNYCMLEFEKPYSQSFEDFGLDRSFDSVGGIF